jgi:hypothetical protein
MPRRKGAKPSLEPVGVRLDEPTHARLSRLIPRYALPGRDGKLSDVLRDVILLGLEVAERRIADIPAEDGSGPAPLE